MKDFIIGLLLEVLLLLGQFVMFVFYACSWITFIAFLVVCLMMAGIIPPLNELTPLTEQ